MSFCIPVHLAMTSESVLAFVNSASELGMPFPIMERSHFWPALINVASLLFSKEMPL